MSLGEDDATAAVRAVLLLRSTHVEEVHAAEEWLLTHREVAVPALVEGLATPSAQAAARLLGRLGAVEAVPELVAAHRRGGIGLRAAVEAGLGAMDDEAARAALASLE